jgi:hypothetical protein
MLAYFRPKTGGEWFLRSALCMPVSYSILIFEPADKFSQNFEHHSTTPRQPGDYTLYSDAQYFQHNYNSFPLTYKNSRSHWPRGLRRRSAAERLLGSWFRSPPRAWMSVLYSVCVVRYKYLRSADPSSRGVLPTVVCECDPSEK